VIRVNTTSFIPIYEQIKKETVRLVATGVLKPHDTLPSIRDLAAELIVNPNTVARAYRELEQDGLIMTQKGRGSFVAGRAQPDIEKNIEAYLVPVLDEAIAEARKFNLGTERIMSLFESRLRKAPDKSQRGGRHE
jgi:GntR family transcriptional regulator